jgi:outer membrane protein assembly factor BamB
LDRDESGYAEAREWLFYTLRRSARNITLAVRPGNARGDLTQSHVLWSADRYVPEVPTPLVYQGLLYMVKDGGILSVMNLESGENLKVSRMPGAIDKYYSSPVVGDGKIYLISETGKLSVLRPGVDWETLAVNDMGEPGYATPAIEDGKIYLRTSSSLYCFANQN